MDITEIRKQKSVLDEAIANLVREFETKTGLYVNDIKIERVPMYTGHMNVGGLLIYTEVKV